MHKECVYLYFLPDQLAGFDQNLRLLCLPSPRKSCLCLLIPSLALAAPLILAVIIIIIIVFVGLFVVVCRSSPSSSSHLRGLRNKNKRKTRFFQGPVPILDCSLSVSVLFAVLSLFSRLLWLLLLGNQ